MASPIELKPVDSMPGSINELLITNKRLKRPPSLSESFAWTEENIERAYHTVLLSVQEQEQEQQQEQEPSNLQNITVNIIKKSRYCSEKAIVATLIKLLLHITLISVFETIFFFLYVSTLENKGIEKTVSSFINGATSSCANLTKPEIELVDDLLEPFINVTEIIKNGDDTTVNRTQFNNQIMLQSWYYVVGLFAFFILTLGYIKVRKVKIKWQSVILDNLAMVLLLAIYEFMFFETIIYNFQPLTASEISRNAIQRLQDVCGILENG
jgi:hypothetical protein